MSETQLKTKKLPLKQQEQLLRQKKNQFIENVKKKYENIFALDIRDEYYTNDDLKYLQENLTRKIQVRKLDRELQREKMLKKELALQQQKNEEITKQRLKKNNLYRQMSQTTLKPLKNDLSNMKNSVGLQHINAKALFKRNLLNRLNKQDPLFQDERLNNNEILKSYNSQQNFFDLTLHEESKKLKNSYVQEKQNPFFKYGSSQVWDKIILDIEQDKEPIFPGIGIRHTPLYKLWQAQKLQKRSVSDKALPRHHFQASVSTIETDGQDHYTINYNKIEKEIQEYRQKEWKQPLVLEKPTYLKSLDNSIKMSKRVFFNQNNSQYKEDSSYSYF